MRNRVRALEKKSQTGPTCRQAGYKPKGAGRNDEDKRGWQTSFPKGGHDSRRSSTRPGPGKYPPGKHKDQDHAAKNPLLRKPMGHRRDGKINLRFCDTGIHPFVGNDFWGRQKDLPAWNPCPWENGNVLRRHARRPRRISPGNNTKSPRRIWGG